MLEIMHVLFNLICVVKLWSVVGDEVTFCLQAFSTLFRYTWKGVEKKSKPDYFLH